MTISKAEAAKIAAATQEHLETIRANLDTLRAQFSALTDWTNSQGDVQGSATLYKLHDDLGYLLDVAPRIVNGVVS